MKAVEKEGPTVEEAVMRALQTLSVSREEVTIEVLDDGSVEGLDAAGAEADAAPLRMARVRVTLQPSAQARMVTKEILEKMGIKAATRVTSSEEDINIQIETAGTDGLLIGTRGETIAALQHLVQRIMGRLMGGRLQVTLDVSGYRARRADALRKKAMSLAERVRTTGQEITMEPLPPEDRKTIHQTLAEVPGITTRTVGEEPNRTIVIALRAPESA